MKINPALSLAFPVLISASVENGDPLFASRGNINDGLLDAAKHTPLYTAFDDASWAVTSTNLSNMLGANKQHFYDDFIENCVQRSDECRSEEADRMFMNRYQPPAMVNYTKTGFAKIRAPEELFQLLKNFWDANYNRAESEANEMERETSYHNNWLVPTKILKTEEDVYIGGGWNLSAAVWNAARDILEDWTGQKLAGSSVYGIRIYQNQSILAPHVDRLPLVSSAIINVAQDVEEDWFLEVYGHDGKATNVSMKPGDMILYESHSVIHGRPFPLNGKYYANVFVHFEPMGDTNSTDELPDVGSRPPYLVPGSRWETEYFKEFPEGWTLLTDLDGMARRGDLYTMKYVAQRERDSITDPAKRCKIMALAATHRHVDMVDFLIQEMDYDINMICNAATPLDHVRAEGMPEYDSMIVFLLEHGAMTYENLIDEHPELAQRFYDHCSVAEEAIMFRSEDLMHFLFGEMEYDINMICHGMATPLDMLMTARENDDNIREEEEEHLEDDPIYAFLIDNDAKRRHELVEREEEGEHEDLQMAQMSDDRCEMLEAAVKFESPDVLFFLARILNFDVNMVCYFSSSSSDEAQTALDLALELFGHENDDEDEEDENDPPQDHAIIDFLVTEGGLTLDELDEEEEQESEQNEEQDDPESEEEVTLSAEL